MNICWLCEGERGRKGSSPHDLTDCVESLRGRLEESKKAREHDREKFLGRTAVWEKRITVLEKGLNEFGEAVERSEGNINKLMVDCKDIEEKLRKAEEERDALKGSLYQASHN